MKRNADSTRPMKTQKQISRKMKRCPKCHIAYRTVHYCERVHNVVKDDVLHCYYCTVCHQGAGDGDGFVGQPCPGYAARGVKVAQPV